MIEEPEVGTLVIASAGAGTQVDHVIALRDRTDKNVAFFLTASREDKVLARLKSANIPIFYSPQKLASGLKSLIDYHAWREHRLAAGAASAPPLTAEQQTVLERLRAPGRSTLSEKESKQIIAGWGISGTREIACRVRRRGRRGGAQARLSGCAQDRFAGHPSQDRGRRRAPGAARCR